MSEFDANLEGEDSEEGRTLDLNLSDTVKAESKMSVEPQVEVTRSTIPAEVVTGSEIVLTEEQEQEIRDRYGYAPTEKRTKAERDAAADRMLGKLRAEPLDLPEPQRFADDEELPPDPPLPREVTDVWGVSEESLSLAKSLIDAWGLNRFLNSELHTQAVKEKESSARLAPIRAAYVKAMKEKEKKK